MGYVVHILEMRPVYSSDRVEYVLDFVDGRYFVLHQQQEIAATAMSTASKETR